MDSDDAGERGIHEGHQGHEVKRPPGARRRFDRAGDRRQSDVEGKGCLNKPEGPDTFSPFLLLL